MIPTINQILTDYAAGQISKDEALRLIKENFRLDKITYGEHVKSEAVKVCRDKVDPEWPNDDISEMANTCAAAIEKMPLP